MERYEGSNAVSNARSAILALGWICILAGAIIAIIGFAESYIVEWEIVFIGVLSIVFAVMLFIANAILKGVEQIARASETYMYELEKRKIEEKEDKTIRLPMQGDVKTPTHI